MSMLLLLAMASFTNVSPVLPVRARGTSDWITSSDFPQATREGLQARYTQFALLISPEGKVDRCDVTGTSGDRNLDSLTCTLVSRRAKFQPAIDQDGHPAYAGFSSAASWVSGETTDAIKALQRRFPPPPSYDAEVTVNQLPAGAKAPVLVQVGVAVDANGAIVGCGVDQDKNVTQLASIACEQARSFWKPLPSKTSDGRSVGSVQSVRIRFQLASAPPPN